jgi:hypothetical protein
MSSLIATVTTAMLAALTGAPGVPAVSRIKLRPLAAGVGQLVVVRPMGAEVVDTDMAGNPVSWSATVAVECYARATAGQAPDVVVDATVSAVYAALMADATLGGQVIATQPQHISYDFDTDAEQTVCATFTFSVQQTSAAGIF